MKDFKHIFSFSASSFLVILTYFLSGAVYGQSSDYQESTCYREYHKVYKDVVQSRLNNLKFRRDLAYHTGMILNQTESSDWGEEEKSIINAADLSPSYDPSKVKNSLNAFSFIHREVIKEYPEMGPYQTRDYIRRGFEQNRFCSKFLVFKFRNSRRKVASWIKKQIEKDLEKSAISFSHISDSELNKGDSLRGENGTEMESPAKVENN